MHEISFPDIRIKKVLSCSASAIQNPTRDGFQFVTLGACKDGNVNSRTSTTSPLASTKVNFIALWSYTLETNTVKAIRRWYDISLTDALDCNAASADNPDYIVCGSHGNEEAYSFATPKDTDNSSGFIQTSYKAPTSTAVPYSVTILNSPYGVTGFPDEPLLVFVGYNSRYPNIVAWGKEAESLLPKFKLTGHNVSNSYSIVLGASLNAARHFVFIYPALNRLLGGFLIY